MAKEKRSKSAASVKVLSYIKCLGVYPKKAVSNGILVNKQQAVEMARNLLILAGDPEVQGDIIITGHQTRNEITLLGYKK